MTEQRELDRLLGDFFVDGTNEISDRVIDAALDQIDHTRQRRALRVPWRFPTMTMPLRLATAALIGALVLGGAFVLFSGGGSRPLSTAPSQSPTTVPTAAVSPTPSSAWRITGNPSIDRGNSLVAVRLLDGRMLLAGGGNGPLNTAELYDPAGGTWTPTRPMTVGRGYPIAVRLADGKVLVAGGAEGSADTVEIFDPATATWTPTGSLVDGRNQGFGALLSDGRVLAFGGGNDGGKKSAELYDPKTGSWTPTGDMTVVRAGPLGATRLDDGRILVTGGFTDDDRSAEIYDPVKGTWAATARMSIGRGAEQSAIPLADGTVLVCGGQPTSCELYHSSTGTWTFTGALVESYSDLITLDQLPGGKVLLVAGGGSKGGDRATAQLYDPASNTWSAAEATGQTVFVRAASTLADGTVLVVGSSTTAVGGQPGSEVYRPAAGS